MRPEIALGQARGGGLLRALAGHAVLREEGPRRGLAGALSLPGCGYLVSGTHVVVLRSYLRPGADFSASFVVSRVK